jgi:GTP cyclohydrolase-4
MRDKERPLDVQSQKPRFPLRIEKAGIVNVIKEVVFNSSGRPYNVVASFDVFTDLPEWQRGMHMSRPGEAIMDILESSSSLPIKTFEGLCEEISKRTLEVSESSSYAETRLRGAMVLRSRSKINDRVTTEPIKVISSAKAQRAPPVTQHSIGVIVSGMTVCPCALEMIRDYSKDLLGAVLGSRKTQDQSDLIDRALNELPLASHVQRGTAKLVGYGAKPGALDVYDLVDIAERAMSSPTQAVLKRVDEASLVRTAFSRPRFVEDVVREMGMEVARTYGGKVSQDTSFLFVQRNFESIHKHDVKAILKASLGELVEQLSLIEKPNAIHE